MIGIDTNIVVRVLLRDNEDMFQRAMALLSGVPANEPLIVNAVVVAESLWVLERRAKVERRRARETLLGFLDSDQIRVHETNPFRSWDQTLASGHRDYSDLIISAINREIGCEFTYTMDDAAANAVPGMRLLA